MKKILTIFTGGTICTTLKNGVMNTTGEATAALTELYKANNPDYIGRLSFESGKSFGILSENMTAEKWTDIATYFLENLAGFSSYDGIIVAHGTDTLAFTTSLFSILLNGFDTPVIFVSGNYPILTEDGNPNPRSNGCANFDAAVECICRGIAPGVYATYQNPADSKTYLHNGAHLIQCKIYDDNFYSRDAIDITNIEEVNFASLQSKTSGNSKLPIRRLENKALKNCILKITPYTGMNYDMFNLSEVKAVLHGTYHSGTACTIKTDESPNYNNCSVLYFFEKCAAANIPFYFSPSQTGEKTNVYASVPFIEHHSFNGQRPIFLYGDTDELLYAKLIFAYSAELSEKEIKDLLKQTF
ncbi:MAG: asparaginase [Clostridia bacterium]|nr:asparaginase [Clostridia bacterium]